MAFKALLLALALVSTVAGRNVQPSNVPLTQEYRNIEETRLQERTINHIIHPRLGIAISIPHLILDTLEACTVEYPNGLTYEVYPNSNLPSNAVTDASVFRSCHIEFRDVTLDLAGTYELTALTSHWDGRRTLRRQRFIVNIRESSSL